MSAALSPIVAALVGHASTLLAHVQPAPAGSPGGSSSGGGAASAAPGGGGAGGAPGGGGLFGGGSMQMLFLLGTFAFMYFFMIRPANKQRQEQEKLQKGLQKGDQVVTSSGLIGTVVTLEARFVVLELAEKVRVKILRDAITGPWDGGAAKSDKDGEGKGASKDASADKK